MLILLVILSALLVIVIVKKITSRLCCLILLNDVSEQTERPFAPFNHKIKTSLFELNITKFYSKLMQLNLFQRVCNVHDVLYQTVHETVQLKYIFYVSCKF